METNTKYRIALFVSNPKDIYSGGRYFGLMLAEAMAQSGHEVNYVTNQLPIFWTDLECLESHHKINVVAGWQTAMEVLPEDLDFVFIVPGTSDGSFYGCAMGAAISRQAHVCLINFESENWFNKYAPVKKPSTMWEDWRRIASGASLIMSIADEGTSYAKDYYTRIPKHCSFFTCYPPINTVAADQAAGIAREKRIILLTRFSGDAHKGGSHISDIVDDALSGYTLTILVGTGVVPDDVRAELEAACDRHHVKLDWQFKLSDKEKFELYHRSELLLFPSLFEGYGYPPIEARYCGCRVVAFDLPVLRETCGDDIILAKHGDIESFKIAMKKALQEQGKPTGYRLGETAHLEGTSKRLDVILADASNSPADHTLYLSTYGRPDCMVGQGSLTGRFDDRLVVFLQLLRRKLKIRRGRITYFPIFTGQRELTNHYHRAAWYFPEVPGLIEEVCFYVSDPAIEPGPAPGHMQELDRECAHIKIRSGKWRFLLDLVRSDVVMLTDGQCSSGWISIIKSLGIPMVNVDTTDVAAKEYGDYPGVLWRHLLSPVEKNEVLQKSFDNLNRLGELVDSKELTKSAVFGTGPSLEKAYNFDFSNTLTIICNSTVQNERLMDHLDPLIVTAGDVVSHFGVSKYAAKFRVDLVNALENRGIYYLGTATFGALLLYHFPELKEKIILIEQTHDGPNFDLLSEFAVPKLDSTMNTHMLPLAATFSDEIFVLGCDGKAPSGDNEDFWSHAKGAQYHDLVDTGHACHPVFDIHRQQATYDRHLDSVQTTLEEGEKKYGKRYTCLLPSYIPAFAERSLGAEWYEKNSFEQSTPKSVALISDCLGAQADQTDPFYCDSNLPSLLSVSNIQHASGVLSIRGWFLSPHRKARVLIEYNNCSRYLMRRTKRPDVAKNYPEYAQESCGIEYMDSVEGALDQVRLSLVLGTEVLQSKVLPITA